MIRESESRGCPEGALTVYANGIRLSAPRKEYGCQGEVRNFTTTSTLIEPITYTWSIDGNTPVLGTDSFFNYTFDNKTHDLSVWAHSTLSNCSVLRNIKVIGSVCPICTATECMTVTVPAGELISIVTTTNKILPIDGNIILECTKLGNKLLATAIKRAIMAEAKCQTESLKVILSYNRDSPCINIAITNSPIKLRSIGIGGQFYNFKTC